MLLFTVFLVGRIGSCWSALRLAVLRERQGVWSWIWIHNIAAYFNELGAYRSNYYRGTDGDSNYTDKSDNDSFDDCPTDRHDCQSTIGVNPIGGVVDHKSVKIESSLLQDGIAV